MARACNLIQHGFWMGANVSERSTAAALSEHRDAPRGSEPRAIRKDNATKGSHNPKEINPKIASGIAYWSEEFDVTGAQLHRFVRTPDSSAQLLRMIQFDLSHKRPCICSGD